MKDPISIFVAADIHSLDGQSNLKSVLSLIASDPTATMPQAVLIGGDCVGTVGGGGGKTPPPPPPDGERPRQPRRMSPEELRRWQPAFRLGDIRQEIAEILGREVQTFFTYGSHDKNEVDGAAGFFCGPASLGAFHLYGISFVQMRYPDDAALAASDYDGPDRQLGGAAEAAARFRAWVHSLSDSLPIFVVSHIPLHYHRHDNSGAAIWAEALNDAAEGHDVFVFFAHNHTAEQRTPLDRQYYFVPAGSVLPVQGRAREEQLALPIRFTYLNAGYIVHGCGTLLTLEGDTLTVRRCALREADLPFGDTGRENPQVIRLAHSTGN